MSETTALAAAVIGEPIDDGVQTHTRGEVWRLYVSGGAEDGVAVAQVGFLLERVVEAFSAAALWLCRQVWPAESRTCRRPPLESWVS